VDIRPAFSGARCLDGGERMSVDLELYVLRRKIEELERRISEIEERLEVRE